MTLKDLLKKKEKISDEGLTPGPPKLSPSVPAFTFMRTTTTTQSIFEPPSHPEDPTRQPPLLSPGPRSPTGRLRRFRRHSNASEAAPGVEDASTKSEYRLSGVLFGRARSASSANIPENLPDVGGDGVAKTEDDEAKWEKRATLLAKTNTVSKSGTTTPNIELGDPMQGSKKVSVGNPDDEVNIQEAIRLHESGNLEASTAMFGKLADPKGPNNALSQVLYGLALRHGWGCEPDPQHAIQYLSYAASNSADVESLALGAGLKKGGSAKGELVLAMYELANCFRNGWGIKKDPVAAKQYYETAANLGDTDAMNEIAWCYLEGFGTKKDKVSQLSTNFSFTRLFSPDNECIFFTGRIEDKRLTMCCYAPQFKAAQFLRLAEKKGSKTLGNTW
ncbi:HCP-like protein [Pleomassaria siparia CBS 279.74]|uniref:HCP-like protein n=1 Tax=Pleomassaria siparia CBS 279.74 TaxID=1314801 RepID=A0A6G1K485_9PLEO|nr:HCP-like protein [Pleomassaria siparia CBS 279.74]